MSCASTRDHTRARFSHMHLPAFTSTKIRLTKHFADCSQGHGSGARPLAGIDTRDVASTFAFKGNLSTVGWFESSSDVFAVLVCHTLKSGPWLDFVTLRINAISFSRMNFLSRSTSPTRLSVRAHGLSARWDGSMQRKNFLRTRVGVSTRHFLMLISAERLAFPWRIRSADHGVPVVFVTGYDSCILPERFHNARCVLKPNDTEKLVTLLSKL